MIYKILSLLEDQAINAIDFADVFVSSGYGASMSKIDYEFSKKNEKRLKDKINREKIRKIQKYLSKLDKEGFIFKDLSGRVNLTRKGKKKLGGYKKSFLLNKREYKKEPGDNVIVISYDIPIVFNYERDLLRNTLRMLGFELIHKSVWIGKVKLPKEFIIDLGKLEILDYIEILEVTKNGSLKHKN